LWRDAEARSVLLFANRITDEKNLEASLLRRVRGTDIWHIAYRMETDWRASYCFLPSYDNRKAADTLGFGQRAVRDALDNGLSDPRNPRQCQNRVLNTLSVVELPDAPPQPWAKPRPELALRGKVSSHKVDGYSVWLYEPPFANDAHNDAQQGDVGAMILFDGDVWVRGAMFPETLNNLIAEGRIPPIYALLVETPNIAARWDDLGKDSGIEYFVTNGLLEWARTHIHSHPYPITDNPDRLIIAGQSLGGLTALRTVLRLPNRIKNAIAQSSSLWRGDFMHILESPADSYLNGFDGRIYMEVGKQEWVLRPYHQKLAAMFSQSGLDYNYVEYNGGHDYVCWRGGIADGLCWIIDSWGRQDGVGGGKTK
jgi:enterochelin esterase family protein